MLGLAGDADEAAIRRAKRTLSLATHPDKIGDAPGAAEAFNLVTEVGQHGWHSAMPTWQTQPGAEQGDRGCRSPARPAALLYLPLSFVPPSALRAGL